MKDSSLRAPRHLRLPLAVVACVVIVALVALVVRADSRGTPSSTATGVDEQWSEFVDDAVEARTTPATPEDDGYEHFIVHTQAVADGSTVGPDGTLARWVKVTGAIGPELLRWSREVVVDEDGATWVRVSTDAPAALTPIRSTGWSNTLADLPDTTLTKIDANTWGVRTTATRAEVEAVPGVANIADDPVISLAAADPVSNDPYAYLQWALQNRGDRYLQTPGDMTAGADANVPGVWSKTRGAGVVVAVIDQRVDFSHPDLANSLWTNPDEPCNATSDIDHDGLIGACHGWDFVANNPTGQLHASSNETHGTHVAGIIGARADNAVGIAGIAPEVTIMPLSVGDSSGAIYLSSATAAINFAAEHHVGVINASWGGMGSMPAMLQTAMNKAEAAGVVFVAAAGNNAANTDVVTFFPANAPNANVISVGSSNALDQPSSFSNYGANSVDVFAPGSLILSTLPVSSGSYGMMSGTSMASPLVAGQVALLRALDPSLTPAEIKARLIASSKPMTAFDGKAIANGRVDVATAVGALASTRGPIRYNFDGFDTLDAVSPQRASVIVQTDDATVSEHPRVGVEFALATRVDGQVYAVTDSELAVKTPNGETTTLTTDDAGTAAIADIDAASLAAIASFDFDLGDLPPGDYAIGAQLVDGDTAVGDPGRIVFAVADHDVVPSTRPPLPTTTTTTIAPPPTTAPPATNPPTTNAPVTSPPTTKAPTNNPPATSPPTTGAPTPNPPSTNPPSTNPPTTRAPSSATTIAPSPTTAPASNPPNTSSPTTVSAPNTSPHTTVPTTNAPSPTTVAPSTSAPPITTVPTTRAPDAPRPMPPDTPTRITGSTDMTSATLTWHGSVDALGYRIYMNTQFVAETTQTSLTITGLNPGQSYEFAVSAYSAYGESAGTVGLSLTTTAPATTTFVAPSTAAPTTVPPTTTPASTVPRVVEPDDSHYAVSPGSGSTAGGTLVTITGSDLDDTYVEIDGSAAERVGLGDPTLITVRTSAHAAAGTYDVVLHKVDRDIVLVNVFRYEADPNAPVTNPPVTPPTTTPGATTPPVTNPPVTTPPVTSPPVTTPPVTSPPVTSPRATTPVTSPPATNPPATSPPTTKAPTPTTVAPTPTTKAPAPVFRSLRLKPLPSNSPLANLTPSAWGNLTCRSARCAG